MREYLISHGKNGGFGRFTSARDEHFHRGDAVVIRTQRGVEIGTVLCSATDRHQEYLADTTVGALLHRATAADSQQHQSVQQQAKTLCHTISTMVCQKNLPVEILDVEMLLEGTNAICQYLAWEACDLEDVSATLQREQQVTVLWEDISPPAVEEEESGGCGEPGCGRATGGGCTSCGSGGCSSCGSGVDMRDYFGHLREKMEQQGRVPLTSYEPSSPSSS